MNEKVYAQRLFVFAQDNDEKSITTLKAEIHALGNQSPYFALTFNETTRYSRRRNDSQSCGVASREHVDLFKDTPEYAALARALRWHLFSVDSGFMHYRANALYFWNIARGNIPMPSGYTKAKAWKAFNHTIGYGLLDETQFEAPHNANSALVAEHIIMGRLAYLIAAFQADMQALFPGLTFDTNHMPSEFGIWRDGYGLPSDDDTLTAILRKAGITMLATEVQTRSDDLMSGNMTHWRIALTRKGFPTLRTFFSMGSAHNGRRPTLEEVVGNLVSEAQDSDMSVQDFANEMGYDDLRKARKVHLAIVKNTDALRDLLGESLFDDLTELA